MSTGSIIEEEKEVQLQWAAIEKLPTFKRIRTSLFDINHGSEQGNGEIESEGKRVTDVTKLGAVERQLFIEKLIKHIENDNLQLLRKIRERIDRYFCFQDVINWSSCYTILYYTILYYICERNPEKPADKYIGGWSLSSMMMPHPNKQNIHSNSFKMINLGGSCKLIFYH